jgi:hypothetical protein
VPYLKSRLTWPVLLCLTTVLVGLAALSEASVAWASPHTDVQFQTLPTLPPITVAPVVTSTPTPQPTSLPGADPTATVVGGPGPIRTAAPTTQTGPDWRLRVYASPAFVVPGMSFDLSISVENVGADMVESLIVHMPIPDTVEMLSATVSAGDVMDESGAFRVELQNLSLGEQLDIRLTLRVNPSTTLGTIIECLVTTHSGAYEQSQVVQVSLPPAQLPVTGAGGETGWMTSKKSSGDKS